MTTYSEDKLMDARMARRWARELAAMNRAERRETEADALIGELCREGREVLYINLKDRNGRPTGKTREGSRSDLISYLLRNNYV